MPFPNSPFWRSMSTASSCRVTVVGGGVIGLASALALLQSGFRSVRVVAASFEDTTSHVAGGLWMPFALPEDADPALPRDSDGTRRSKWCEVSFAWLEELMQQHGEEAGLHVVDGAEVSAVGPPPVLAPQTDAGPAIGSCYPLVGLAAKELAGDDMVFPIRGQVIKVVNSNLDKYLAVVHRNGQHTYVIPRPNGDVVLGGTVQPHNWSTENDADDVDGVWERCCRLYPEVRNSKVVGPVAGLRPGRQGGVRLEMEPRLTKHGALVIHNYAHGGSGHTLHWGCAQDVVALAKQHFPVESISKL
ncbi:hypothetical protein BBJ28_00024157 [Nothophytophthora sp. Chile5]|nr:hypothetical protein BBJ28_00024157 [Nothophytophthora sp. Chile5]